MPSFCRHNRLIQNCTICSREQNVAMRPIVTGGAAERPVSEPREGAARASSPKPRVARTPKAGTRSGSRDVRVRRLARGVDDGFSSPLVPGLRSSEDAERLAEEIAFASGRLAAIAAGESEVWSQIADPATDIEERSWLAFLTAYIGADDSPQPFASIELARVSWASEESPAWDQLSAGPRGGFDADRAEATVAAYRAWAARAGSQQAAFSGESSWTPERRFERVYERLALPGVSRDVRFELLIGLGRTGAYQLRAGMLALSGENEATWAAKRALGIGDPLLLERRAAELASACEAPLEALDLGFHNWGSGRRIGAGVDPERELDQDALALAQDALGL